METSTQNRRIFAFGDIHGRRDQLAALLGRLTALDPEARLVFLGDYIDRGGQSRQVVEELLILKGRRPDTVFLMGNHEVALRRFTHSCSPDDLREMRGLGFQATLDSYCASPGACGIGFMPETHREFFASLTRWLVTPRYVFCHSPIAHGADPDQADDFTLDGLLSSRVVDTAGWAAGGRTLVFGHVPLETPLVAPGLIGVDTGAGHVLTALELPDVRFHHA
ncbi:MAG: metallophosphoesterase [Humidesulfovibrio sp.]|nr:metallophosphoesterase [Humidesulfovibrio sp.]